MGRCPPHRPPPLMQSKRICRTALGTEPQSRECAPGSPRRGPAPNRRIAESQSSAGPAPRGPEAGGRARGRGNRLHSDEHALLGFASFRNTHEPKRQPRTHTKPPRSPRFLTGSPWVSSRCRRPLSHLCRSGGKVRFVFPQSSGPAGSVKVVNTGGGGQECREPSLCVRSQWCRAGPSRPLPHEA